MIEKRQEPICGLGGPGVATGPRNPLNVSEALSGDEWRQVRAERPHADLRLRTAYTATPPSECLNGCESRQSDAVSKVLCEPGQLLCTKCLDRLDTWLRQIADMYALLPSVVDHGTVAADPGTKHTKRPDPPAPMRLEVVDLLDTRDGAGVLGLVHPWAEVIRDERRLLRRCQCGHARPSHDHQHCTALACSCRRYMDGPFYVYAECQLLLAHLPYAAQQDWVADMYGELKQLHRTLSDTVGEYRAKPVGRCAAMVDLPGSATAYSTQQTVCDGPLVMDRDRVGVHCLRCGARHEANHELRQLGLLVDRIFPTKEAS